MQLLPCKRKIPPPRKTKSKTIYHHTYESWSKLEQQHKSLHIKFLTAFEATSYNLICWLPVATNFGWIFRKYKSIIYWQQCFQVYVNEYKEIIFVLWTNKLSLQKQPKPFLTRLARGQANGYMITSMTNELGWINFSYTKIMLK
jgi:hypothetical protein